MQVEQRLIEAFIETHPRDVARRLESLPEGEASAVLESVSPQLAGTLLPAVPLVVSARLLAIMPASHAAAVVTSVDQDLGAALLRNLEQEPRQAVLAACSESRARAFRLLLRYPEGTAGALMDPSVLGVPDDVTVADALERVRRSPAHVLYYTYAVTSEGMLSGVANLRELMGADPDRMLASVIARNPWSLSVTAGAAAITAHPAWERVHALPVVEGRRFVGVLRYKVMRRLERGLAARTPEEQAATTRAALAELFGLGVAGLGGWASAATRGPGGPPGGKP